LPLALFCHSMTVFGSFRLATQDFYSRKATMGRELMAPRTDRTTRIPSGVASPVTTNHAAKGSVFVNLRNVGNLPLALFCHSMTVSGSFPKKTGGRPCSTAPITRERRERERQQFTGPSPYTPPYSRRVQAVGVGGGGRVRCHAIP